MEKTIRYTDRKMPFGKHKDELICDIPHDYLEWLMDQVWFEEKNPILYETVKIELKYRKDYDIKF